MAQLDCIKKNKKPKYALASSSPHQRKEQRPAEQTSNFSLLSPAMSPSLQELFQGLRTGKFYLMSITQL